MSSKSIGVSSYFECPDCKCDYLEEIQTGVVLCSPLTDLHEDDGFVEAEYNVNVGWDGGVVDRYQCSRCGWVIKDFFGDNITNPDDLFVWLIEYKENRDKGDKS